jgi:hypothetical protein
MKINIYKDEKIFISVSGQNATNFFKNKDNLTYTIEPNTIEPNTKTEERHLLKYVFEEHTFNVGINDAMAEAILNEYRFELINE